MNREQFLHPPSEEIVAKWNEPNLFAVNYDKVYEAQCSSLIENENDYETNLAALQHQWQGVNVASLNDAHGILMRGWQRGNPGNFRTINVWVGGYRPPRWELVPVFMFELDWFLKNKNISPVLKAVWGHIMFETIHPYVDGNGRIGRLLVNKILVRPWSSSVLAERMTYYELLNRGDWNEWSSWMVNTLKNCPKQKV